MFNESRSRAGVGLGVAFLAALLVTPSALSGQATASVDARANVLAQLSASQQQALEFGDVIPGFSSTVQPSDGGAGIVALTGAANLQVNLDFTTLPTELEHDTDPTAELPISFAADAAGYGATSSSVDTSFDPASSALANLNGDGSLWVFIGGTVDPAAGQLAGNYSGQLVLEVSYTGS